MKRRDFIKSSAAWATISIVPSHVLGGRRHTPPSETLYIGGIGVGGNTPFRDLQNFVTAGAKVVTLCDVDDERAANAYKTFSEATRYHDFRRMLDKEKGIDAVLVATPDHVHAIATLAAMERGKHVYCEKPLARTLYEVRCVTEAARRYGVVTQLGNQGHASEYIRRFCEWIWDGAIGHVREIHAFANSSYGRQSSYHQLKERPPIPDTLNWDLWLGPVPARPYHDMYVPSKWRYWSQFGTGVIGDWVCHIIDPVFWALDLGAPSTVRAEAGDYDPEQYPETFPEAMKVTYTFPARGKKPPVTLTWYTHQQPPRPSALESKRKLPHKGAYVVGDKGTIVYGSHGARECVIVPHSKMKAYQRAQPSLPRSPGHYHEWVEACKTGHPTGSNFDYGGPLTEIALLGIIASRMKGQELQWDSQALGFTNCPAANALVRPEYRPGWSLPELEHNPSSQAL